MAADTQPFEDVSRVPPVRGFVSRPAKPNDCGLVLTHGAGANCNSALLRMVGDAFAELGYTVLRCDLAFRQARRFGPPHGNGSQDRESLRSAVVAMRQLVRGDVFLGGHSYGGRQASMLAAEDRSIASALLLLSYPLHPPRKPEQLRTAHFPSLRTPALFVHGTRDPFGTIGEMEQAIRLIPGAAGLLPVEGAGHDLFISKGTQAKPGLAAEIAQEFENFRLRLESAAARAN
jgi:predicted alpha/beta-hydrolase family hydrolase